MPAPGEPDYRYYNSNLQCPNFITGTVRCKELIIDSCVTLYAGCTHGVTRCYITSMNLPSLLGSISGKLTVYFRDAVKGGYSEVYLSMSNGDIIITPISAMTFNTNTSIVMKNGDILITLGSTGDVAWTFSGM